MKVFEGQVSIRLLLTTVVFLGAVLVVIGFYIITRQEVSSGNVPPTTANIEASPIVNPAAANNIRKNGFIPVNEAFTEIGVFEGRLRIELSGKARLDSTREEFGPEGWNPGRQAPSFFVLPGSPMFGAVAKINGRLQFIGRGAEYTFSNPTKIELGPNEEPGKDGLGFKDNSGSWTYTITQMN